MIKFTVLGDPVAQGRPRATAINGRARMYDPGKSRDYKNYLRLVASEYAPEKPLEGALDVRIDIYRQIPKSFSRKKIQQAEEGLLRPTTKSDVDNYAKTVMDALNKIIWVDDSQIVSLIANKWYSGKPRVEIEVKPWQLSTTEVKG